MMWSRKLSRYIIFETRNSAPKRHQWVALMSTQTAQGNRHTTQAGTTIDAADVELFSKQMNDWWNPDGAMALLHRMNLIRVPFVRDGLLSSGQRELLPLKGKKILDVGCGGGILSEGLAKLGASVTGIDASSGLIRLAEEHKNIDPKIANNKPEYIHATIEEFTETVKDHFDGVVASEVIEHVQNQDLFVKSCIQATKPGGRLFFTTPNRTRLSQFTVIFFAENVLNSIPKGAHQYEKFITPNELTFLLERNNCHVESIYGVTYNPITGKWSFSEYQHLMYAIQALKLE